jgi:hypothetical protein
MAFSLEANNIFISSHILIAEQGCGRVVVRFGAVRILETSSTLIQREKV